MPSSRLIKKCCKELGLLSRRAAKKMISNNEKEYLVASAMGNDPQKRHGPHTIQRELAFDGIRLPWYDTLNLDLLFCDPEFFHTMSWK